MRPCQLWLLQPRLVQPLCAGKSQEMLNHEAQCPSAITLQYSLYSLKCQCYCHIMLTSLENNNSKDVGEFMLR